MRGQFIGPDPLAEKYYLLLESVCVLHGKSREVC